MREDPTPAAIEGDSMKTQLLLHTKKVELVKLNVDK